MAAGVEERGPGVRGGVGLFAGHLVMLDNV